jgi:multidrug efflux pump subunit AcrB
VLSAVGRVQDRGRLSLVIADHSLPGIAAVGDVVIRTDAAGVVHVRDVATVQQGVVPQWLHVSEDGRPAVLLNIYEQPDGNAVRIAREVQAKLAATRLPPGTRLVSWYDQSELVTQSVASVRDAVLIGLVLAALVLLLFLRNWRITLVAAIVVPATLAATVLVLTVLGMSFNIMTLGGIAAAVGLLIDDVIVMVEHIVRRAAAMPPSVMMLKLIPAIARTSTVAISVAGTTISATSVTRQLRRKTSSTIAASTSPISTASRTLAKDWLTSSLWSYQLRNCTPGGSLNRASLACTSRAICTELPSGCS